MLSYASSSIWKITSLQWYHLQIIQACLPQWLPFLQPSGYSIFYGGDTLIQLGLPWQSYSYQYFNTETSTWDNRGFTTETSSISYTICLYIRLVVTLWFASLIINEDNSYWTWSLVFNGDTPISTHSYLGLLPIIWSCDHMADRWCST